MLSVYHLKYVTLKLATEGTLPNNPNKPSNPDDSEEEKNSNNSNNLKSELAPKQGDMSMRYRSSSTMSYTLDQEV